MTYDLWQMIFLLPDLFLSDHQWIYDIQNKQIIVWLSDSWSPFYFKEKLRYREITDTL